MKKLLLLSVLFFPYLLQAQFIVGAEGMLIEAGATLTVNGLVLQPATDLTVSGNSFSRSGTSEPVDSASNSISCIYYFTAPLTFSGIAGIHYEDSALAGNTEADLNIITTTTATDSVWITTTGSLVQSADNYISQTFSNATIARISATSAATVPLPVTLLEFIAQKDDAARHALLKWEVADGAAAAYFEVQRSEDGKNFIELDKVAATINNSYTLTDHHPLAGFNYYRLKLVKSNGNFQFSPVRPLYFDDEANALAVAPNPFLNEVTLHCTDVRLLGTEGIISDMNGRVISTFRITGNSTPINASAWSPGIYLIQLVNGASFKIEKR